MSKCLTNLKCFFLELIFWCCGNKKSSREEHDIGEYVLDDLEFGEEEPYSLLVVVFVTCKIES